MSFSRAHTDAQIARYTRTHNTQTTRHRLYNTAYSTQHNKHAHMHPRHNTHTRKHTHMQRLPTQPRPARRRLTATRRRPPPRPHRWCHCRARKMPRFRPQWSRAERHLPRVRTHLRRRTQQRAHPPPRLTRPRPLIPLRNRPLRPSTLPLLPPRALRPSTAKSPRAFGAPLSLFVLTIRHGACTSISAFALPCCGLFSFRCFSHHPPPWFLRFSSPSSRSLRHFFACGKHDPYPRNFLHEFPLTHANRHSQVRARWSGRNRQAAALVGCCIRRSRSDAGHAHSQRCARSRRS